MQAPTFHKTRSIIWERPEEASFEQLLAALLPYGICGRKVTDVSRDLARLARNVKGLLYLGPEMITSIAGIGETRASVILAAVELARRQNSSEFLPKQKVNLHSLARHLQVKLEGLGVEQFYLFSFNRNFGLVQEHVLARGGMEAVNIYFRDIVKTALDDKASRVLIAHNHPNHSAQPSEEDIQSMYRLSGVLEELGIYLVDQYIVGLDGVYSCKNKVFLIGNQKKTRRSNPIDISDIDFEF